MSKVIEVVYWWNGSTSDPIMCCAHPGNDEEQWIVAKVTIEPIAYPSTTTNNVKKKGKDKRINELTATMKKVSKLL